MDVLLYCQLACSRLELLNLIVGKLRLRFLLLYVLQINSRQRVSELGEELKAGTSVYIHLHRVSGFDADTVECGQTPSSPCLIVSGKTRK